LRQDAQQCANFPGFAGVAAVNQFLSKRFESFENLKRIRFDYARKCWARVQRFCLSCPAQATTHRVMSFGRKQARQSKWVKDGNMFFLLRVVFWLTVVLVLLPSVGPRQEAAVNVSATEAAVAAGAAVSDVGSFCDRQPGACEFGSQAASVIGQRARAGAKMVYDFFNEHGFRGDSRNATRDTLKPLDIEPVWHGPQGATGTLSPPRRDSRRAD
jgi:Family of unknown function (DUF5330)